MRVVVLPVAGVVGGSGFWCWKWVASAGVAGMMKRAVSSTLMSFEV